MPTDTFLKLPEEKKQKILEAAKKEFARVPFAEASIKNIVENAEIARGSFYQYFESKEDLRMYLLSKHTEEIDSIAERTMKDSKGDIFSFFIRMYDYIIEVSSNNDDMEFYRRIFEELKTSQDNMFYEKENNIIHDSSYFKYINTEKLKIKDEEDKEIIVKMLHTITKKAVVANFKYNCKNKARNEFLKELEFLKYGILKKESEGKEC